MVPGNGRPHTTSSQSADSESTLVSRSSAEVIIRRALEKADRDGAATEETFDVSTLTAIASEVGVPESSVVEALAESRVGIDGQAGLVDRIVGPKTLWSTRSVSVDEETARQRVVDWLQANHGLRPRVRTDGVVVAVRRDDVAGKLGEGLRKVQGLGGLGQAANVRAATAATNNRTGSITSEKATGSDGSVCLVVDVGNKRNEALAGGSAVAVVGVVVVGFTAVAATPLALVALPVCLGAGAVTSRLVHRVTIRQFTSSLEETMDGVANGDRPPHPLDPLKKKHNRRH